MSSVYFHTKQWWNGPAEKVMIENRASLCSKALFIMSWGVPKTTEHQNEYYVVAVAGHFTAVVWFLRVMFKCCSWPTEVMVKGLWQMACGFSKKNHLFKSLLERLSVGKLKVSPTNILQNAVLFHVGKVIQPLDCVSLGHRYWNLFILILSTPGVLLISCL